MKYFLTLLAALCVALATPARAATYTFTAASGTPSPFGFLQHDWSDAANWSPAGFPVGGPPLDLVFPGLPVGLLVPFPLRATVICPATMPTLHDLTFNAPHVYVISLSNCVTWQIDGTLTQNGAADTFIHAGSGRLHLINPTLAGSGVGLLTINNPESITGPITLTGGNHQWHIGANAFCSPGSAPPVLSLTTLTANSGDFRLLSEVNLSFAGAVSVNVGATLCIRSPSSVPITVTAPSWAVAAGGTLKYGTGVSSGPGSITVAGTFAAGCSVATAMVGGDLAYTSTGTMEFELGTPGVIGGSDNDLLNVTGNLTLDGTLVVLPQAGFGPGTYRLFNYSGTLTDHGVNLGALPAGLSATLNMATPGQVNLIVAQSLDCCAGCAPPYSASLTVNVPPGYSYLVNPLCHGADNALGLILANPPDGSQLLKWNKATQTYDDPFNYDSGFGGWVDGNLDPASSAPLPPGEGFIFFNPNPTSFSLTFTGCEPQCPPRCPPTNGLCLVGRTGSATNAVHWEDIFNCPPVCGSFVHIFNGSGFTTYTYLNTGWSPATPTWAAGTAVFVGRTDCDPCIGATSAILTTIGLWNLGEDDAGAVAGNVANSLTTDISAPPAHLIRVGSPTYSSATPGPGSTLSVNFSSAAGQGFHYGGPITTVVNNFGVEAWVRSTTTAGVACIAYNGNPGNSGWGLYRVGANWMALMGGVSGSLVSPVTVNTWTHLAMVRDSGTTRLYVNGVAIGTTTTLTPNVPTFDFGLGSLGTEFFDGNIDQARVFTFCGPFAPSDLLYVNPCTSTNLLVNGSFEDGTFNNNGDDCQTLLNGSTIMPGWTVTLDQAARCQGGVLSGVTASQGSKLMDLTGYDNVVPHAGVTQTVPTTIGQCYRLSFDLGVNPQGAGIGGPITVRASAGSSGWRTFTHNPSGPGTQWSTYGFSFTASSASTAITIEGLSANPYFIGLDNVVLTRSCDCTNNGCVIAITCPPDITVSNAPGLCSAVVNYPAPGITESCGANVTVTCTPPSGSSFAVGTNTVTCTATNVAGQSAQCTFSVTVRDAEPPVMGCPQSITVTNCLLPQLVVSASDNCTASNRLVFTQFPPGGTPVGAGTIVVVTRVCDSAGNCIDCDSLVTLVAPRDKYLVLNTGTDAADTLLPGGSPEARWVNLFAPGGPTPMVVINPSSVPGAWVGGSTRSRWIGPNVSSAGPTGPYTNRWSFDAPCTRVCLTGRFTSDDDGYLFVNGQLVAGPSGFSAWTSVNVCSGFVSGVNTLELVVNNRGGNTGFRTELEIWTECCNACVMTQACVAVPANPAHWYTGGSGRDLAGGTPGTLEPGVTIVPGKIGNAMRFNGMSGGMNLGNVPDLDFGANDSFTIEAWFNSRGPTALPNDGQIIVSLNYECSNEAQNLGIDWLSPSPFVYFFIRDEFGNNPGTLVSPPITPNVWHHVAAVRDRSVNPPQVRLYLDCELVDVKTDITTGKLSRDCADFIGRRNTCTTENVFNGDIDEVTFYKRALTGLELRKIAGAIRGKCRPDCAPLPPCVVSLWKAENNSKNSITSHHGKSFNGTAYVPGASGRAWSFDGVNDYMSVVAWPALDVVNALTLCAWVSADGTPSVPAVIAGRPLGYQLNLLPNRKVRFFIATGPGVFESIDTPFPVAANRFTFVAGTYDRASGVMNLYVDCALVASRTLPATPALYHRTGDPFQIGGFHDPTIPFTGGFLRGRVDDVGLFSCALTPAEIGARCNAGETGWCGHSKMFIEPLGNGQLLLEWDNASGTLQRASSPLGPWMDVPGTEGSLEVAPAGEAGYFRVRGFELIDPQ